MCICRPGSDGVHVSCQCVWCFNQVYYIVLLKFIHNLWMLIAHLDVCNIYIIYTRQQPTYSIWSELVIPVSLRHYVGIPCLETCYHRILALSYRIIYTFLCILGSYLKLCPSNIYILLSLVSAIWCRYLEHSNRLRYKHAVCKFVFVCVLKFSCLIILYLNCVFWIVRDILKLSCIVVWHFLQRHLHWISVSYIILHGQIHVRLSLKWGIYRHRVRYTVVVLFVSCKVYIYVVYSLSGWLPLCSIAAICSVVLTSYALALRPCNDKFHISLYILTWQWFWLTAECDLVSCICDLCPCGLRSHRLGLIYWFEISLDHLDSIWHIQSLLWSHRKTSAFTICHIIVHRTVFTSRCVSEEIEVLAAILWYPFCEYPVICNIIRCIWHLFTCIVICIYAGQLVSIAINICDEIWFTHTICRATHIRCFKCLWFIHVTIAVLFDAYAAWIVILVTIFPHIVCSVADKNIFPDSGCYCYKISLLSHVLHLCSLWARCPDYAAIRQIFILGIVVRQKHDLAVRLIYSECRSLGVECDVVVINSASIFVSIHFITYISKSERRIAASCRYASPSIICINLPVVSNALVYSIPIIINRICRKFCISTRKRICIIRVLCYMEIRTVLKCRRGCRTAEQTLWTICLKSPHCKCVSPVGI